MNSPRQRRELTADEAVSFLPATDEQMAADELDLQNVIPGLPEKYFHVGKQQGWCRVSNIIIRDQVQYRLYWQMRALGEHLHVMASLFVGTGANQPDVWAAGAEALARSMNAKKITFETRRKGHIIQAQSWGAVVTGVTMEKVL
jgi:hypothetical protein